MSWSSVKPYFQGILETQGFWEWPDGLNFENIPSNKLHKSYHLQINGIFGEPINQNDQGTNYQLTVRLFYKGYNEPDAAIDTSVADSEAFIEAAVKASSRLGTTIKNVIFETLAVEPIDVSNDNYIVVEIDFTARVILPAV